MSLKLWFIFAAFVTEIPSVYHVQASLKEECSCYCSEFTTRDVTICQKLTQLEIELSMVNYDRIRDVKDISNLTYRLDLQEYEIFSFMGEPWEVGLEWGGLLGNGPPRSKPEYHTQMEMDISDKIRETKKKMEELEKFFPKLWEDFCSGSPFPQPEEKTEDQTQMEMDISSEIRKLKERMEQQEIYFKKNFLGGCISPPFPQPAKKNPKDQTQEDLDDRPSSKKELGSVQDRIIEALEKQDARLKLIEATINRLDEISVTSKWYNNLTDHISDLKVQFELLKENVESRIAKVENETVTVINEKLKNVSSEVASLSRILSDNKNRINAYKRDVRKEFESRITQLENDTIAVIHEELKKLSSEVVTLKLNLSRTQETVSSIENEEIILAANVTTTENNLRDLNSLIDSSFIDYNKQLQDQFASQMTKLEKETVTVIHEELKNLSSEVVTLKLNLSHAQETVSSIENDGRILAANISMTENKMHDLDILIDSRFRECTTQLQNEFESRITQIENDTVAVIHKELKNLSSEVVTVKLNLSHTQEKVSSIENDGRILAANVTITENNLRDLNLVIDSRFKECTTQLQNEFESRITQIENDTIAVIHEELKNLSSEVVTMKLNLSHTQETVSGIENDGRILAANVTITENNLRDLNFLIDTRFTDVDAKLDNLTECWIGTLDPKTKEVLAKNSEKCERIPVVQREIEAFNSRIVPCSLPKNSDTHLFVTMKNNENGQQQLLFACSPVGQYVLRENPNPVRCEKGRWLGTLPACEKLLSEEEINSLAEELKSVNPCSKYEIVRDFSDPTDCFQFYKCCFSRPEKSRCPVSKCSRFNTPETEKLRNLIPTILVDAGNVDEPYGLKGTSPEGHLVVYSGTSLKLHCLYPENIWGTPQWSTDTQSNNIHSSLMSMESTKNRVTLEVKIPTIENIGVYTCITPFGRQQTISIKNKM